jgi:hypothetical protein
MIAQLQKEAAEKSKTCDHFMTRIMNRAGGDFYTCFKCHGNVMSVAEYNAAHPLPELHHTVFDKAKTRVGWVEKVDDRVWIRWDGQNKLHPYAVNQLTRFPFGYDWGLV